MKIVIVDDDLLVRDGLKMIIEMEEDMEVVGVASNGKEAFEQSKNCQPDVVLMDIRMPEWDGIQGTQMIKAAFPRIKILILTTFKDDSYIQQALANGAEGYMMKNQSADVIVNGIRALYKGSFVFEKGVMEAVKDMMHQKPLNHAKEGFENLSERELEILELISQGYNNQEIAGKLFIGQGTVRNYVTGLLDKLELRDRTQLAIYYLKK